MGCGERERVKERGTEGTGWRREGEVERDRKEGGQGERNRLDL